MMPQATLLAQNGEHWALITVMVVMVVLLVSAFSLWAKQYKRCPTNRILVIYGKTGREGQTAKTIHGGAAFVVPLLQDYAYLTLEPIPVTISPPANMLQGQLGFEVPRSYTVAIGTAPELMQNAAVRLLGLSTVEIEKEAKGLILDELVELVQTMGEAPDREEFHAKLQAGLERRLGALGLQLISFRRE